MKKKTFYVLCSTFYVLSLGAETKIQAVFETDIAPDLKVTWVVVDDFPKREPSAKEALKKAGLHAREILDRLDPLNPSSETALFLSKKEAGSFEVSSDLAKILYTTHEIAKQIKEPLAKKIKVDLEKNRVQLKNPDVIINIEPVLKGYLADQMMEDLLEAGFTNGFLDLQGVFVTRGNDFNGPWKIQVSDGANGYAHHAFFYKAFDISAATVHWEEPGMSLPATDVRSATIFTKAGACRAQGLAVAVYAMGLENAKRFLESAEIDRAVLIDQEGKFYQFPQENGKKL